MPPSTTDLIKKLEADVSELQRRVHQLAEADMRELKQRMVHLEVMMAQHADASRDRMSQLQQDVRSGNELSAANLQTIVRLVIAILVFVVLALGINAALVGVTLQLDSGSATVTAR